MTTIQIDYRDKRGKQHGARKHLDQYWHVAISADVGTIRISSPMPTREEAQAYVDKLASRYNWEEIDRVDLSAPPTDSDVSSPIADDNQAVTAARQAMIDNVRGEGITIQRFKELQAENTMLRERLEMSNRFVVGTNPTCDAIIYTIERKRKINGTVSWAICTGDSEYQEYLNRDGKWEGRPFPKPTQEEFDAFLQRCRYETFDEALAVFRAYQDTRGQRS